MQHRTADDVIAGIRHDDQGAALNAVDRRSRVVHPPLLPACLCLCPAANWVVGDELVHLQHGDVLVAVETYDACRAARGQTTVWWSIDHE